MKRYFPILISVVLFVAAAVLYSRGLDFPPYYHPDEINKVIQLRDNERNFHHPQLMLNVAAILKTAAGSPQDTLEIARAARWASVLFAAAAVAFLAYVAFLLAGPFAQLATGWLVLTQPRLFELAHYLKEDPALAMGFAGVYLAFLLYERRPSRAGAAVVGFAAAVAISAKYIGVYPAILALFGMVWLSFRQRPSGPTGTVWIFLAACLVSLCVINWQVLVEFAGFQYGLGREVALFQDKAESVINPKTFSAVKEELGFWAWPAALVWLAVPWYQHRRLRVGEVLILVAIFGYALMLAASSRAASRYLLPITVSLCLLIPVAACWLGDALARKVKWPPLIGQALLCLPLLLLFAGTDLPTLQRFYTGFQSDPRLDLVRFLKPVLPPDAIIAEDRQAKLPTASDIRRSLDGWNLPQQIIRPDDNAHLADDFTLADLRARGVTHVVILVDGQTRSALKGREEKLSREERRIREFITSLQGNGREIWSRESGSPAYINPELRVFALAPANP